MEAYDIVIVGAGPIGLAFSVSLAQQNLKILVLEKENASKIADPIPDGREIALTHRSIEHLKQLDAWQYIDTTNISPIKTAQVLNGTSPYVLSFDAKEVHKEALGHLVPNYKIRKALYEAFCKNPHLELCPETTIQEMTSPTQLTLSNGRKIHTKLLIAADNRFSKTRQMMGISASMHDFGRSMMVCEMTHEKPHHHIAQECFFYKMTLATLPLNGNRSSIIITLPTIQTEQMMTMDKEAFAKEIEQKIKLNLGKMTLTTKPTSYPLVGVYANHFYADHFALIGDAAVGMHPITAHGFNFGLAGVKTLSDKIKNALKAGLAFDSTHVLKQYHREHRRATRALYLATNAIAMLYANETLPMKMLRNAGLKVAHRFAPCKKFLIHKLTHAS